MARSARNAKLESRTARLKLAQGQVYFVKVGKGLSVGYRRTTGGYGTWQVRIFKGAGAYRYLPIGTADDQQDANGVDVFEYFQAQAEARRLYDEHVRGRPEEELTVQQAADRYLNWYQDHRKSYVETKAAVKAHILPAFGPRTVDSLKASELRAWHQKLATLPPRRRSKLGKPVQYGEKPATEDDKRARRASANRVLTVLKAMLNKALEDDLVSDAAAWKNVKPFKGADAPRVRFLTEAESTRLINSCEADFRRLVRGALFTGARYSELSQIRVSDIDLKTASVFIAPSKSGKSRHIPLNGAGQDFFRTLIAGKLGNVAAFQKKDGAEWGKNHHVRALKEACTKAKITPSVGFHELRHTYASLLAQAGADLLTISKLLGHADTRVTSRHYAHLCDRTLSNAVNRLLPDFGHIPEKQVRALRGG